MRNAECNGFLPVYFWKCEFEKDRSGILAWSIHVPGLSSSWDKSSPAEKIVKSQYIEENLWNEKNSFAQVDSLKREFSFAWKSFLHALKCVENIMFKSGIDFNFDFSAKVKIRKK